MDEISILDATRMCHLVVMGLHDQATIMNGDINIQWDSAGIIDSYYYFNITNKTTGEEWKCSFYYKVRK